MTEEQTPDEQELDEDEASFGEPDPAPEPAPDQQTHQEGGDSGTEEG